MTDIPLLGVLDTALVFALLACLVAVWALFVAFSRTPDEARLSRLERQLEQVLEHRAAAPTPAADRVAPAALTRDEGPTGFLAEVSLLAKRNKIEAIKVYRERSGVGLKEAKDAVEAIQRGLPPGGARPS